MKIYFTKIGVEKSRDTSQDNFVYGDNLTGTIEAYFDELDPKNYLNRLVVQRPDGTRTNELPMILTQDQLGVYYQLNNSLINQAGTYHITIRLKEANDGEYIIKAASQFDIIIDKGVMASDDTNITSAEYASLVDKLNKVDVKASVAKQYTSLEEVGFNDAKFHIGTDLYNACSKLPRGCRIYLNLVKDVDKTKYPNFYSFITSQPDAYKCLNDVSYIKTFNIEIVNTRGVYKDDNSINGITQYYVNFNALENEIETTVSYVWGLNGELWFKTSNKVYSNFDEISYDDSEDINAFGNKRGTILLLKNYIEQNKDLYPVLYDRLKAVNGYATDNDAMFIIQHSYDENHDITSLMYTNGNSLHYYTTNGWVEIKKTDDQINANSDNPISNKAITNYLNSIVEGLKNGTTHVGYAEKAYKDSYGSIINVSNLLASISSLLGNSEDSSDKKTIWGLSNRISETQQMFNQQLSAVNIDLQGQIDAINAGQNLADIVGTFADLENYNTEYLHVGDKIEVMQDETHSNSSTIYNWNGTAFEYVGSFGGGGGGGNSYTKAESDERYAKKDETYTKLEADNKFVQSKNTVLTGTTKLENAIISGDGKIHHLEVEDSITVPNPSDKTNATNKEYVDNGTKYDKAYLVPNTYYGIMADYNDKLTSTSVYYTISTDADTDFGTFFIKGNDNLPKYNGTITLNGANNTLTFKWNNGAEDISESIIIPRSSITPIANLLTNLELKNNGYFNSLIDITNSSMQMLLSGETNVIAELARNEPILVPSYHYRYDRDFKTLYKNANNLIYYDNNKFYNQLVSKSQYAIVLRRVGQKTESIWYSDKYIYKSKPTEEEICASIISLSSLSGTLDDTTCQNIRYGKTLLAYRTKTSSGAENFVIMHLISKKETGQSNYMELETTYNNKKYHCSVHQPTSSSGQRTYEITITDLPSTELPVITLTGYSGTLTTEQAALLDKDNVIIKAINDPQDTATVKTLQKTYVSTDTWHFTSSYIDAEDTANNETFDIDITLNNGTYSWQWTTVDLTTRFGGDYQTQIDELKTGKQDIIKSISIAENATSISANDLTILNENIQNYIEYSMTLGGNTIVVDLKHAKTRGEVKEYAGSYLGINDVSVPVSLTILSNRNIVVRQSTYQSEIQVVNISDVPKDATQGTFTQDDIDLLQANSFNQISFNNETYIQMDNEYEAGHLVYTHVGQDTTNSFFTKSINITLSTRGWVLTKIKQASVEYVDNKVSFASATIESSSWTDLTGSDPFKAQCNITLLELSNTKDVLELINDNAVLFANYGFNIGAVSNTTVTIYALKKPTDSVTLQFEMEG